MRDQNVVTSLDETVRTLADPQRRVILECLLNGEGSTSVEELVDELCTADASGGDPDPQRLRIELHHVHLPKLEEAGLIEATRTEVTYLGDERTERMLTILQGEHESSSHDDIRANR